MPHYTPDNILVITYDELVPRWYKSFNSLEVTISNHQKRGFGMKKYRSGCYKNEALIIFESLPKHIKNELHDPSSTQHVMEPHFCIDGDAVSFYQTHEFWDGSIIDDDKIIEQYAANASAINAVFKLMDARIAKIKSQNHLPKKIWQTLCEDAISFKDVMQKKYGISHNLPENYRRFQELCIRYKSGGYSVLISGKHLNKNGAKVNDEVISILEQLFAYIDYKPSFTEVSEAYDGFLNGYIQIINNNTGEMYDNKSYPKLSKATVYRYLTEWKSKIATQTIRSGDRQKLMGKFKPYHSMDCPNYSGSLISIDDRQPPFEYAKKSRMWVYMGIDVHSECYVGWAYGKTKEGIILEFYRNLARNMYEWGVNMPAELECESSLNSSYKNTFLAEGSMFQFVRIEANNARGKIIERYNGILRNNKERKMKGWIARPFAQAEYLQANSEKKQYVPYDSLVAMILKEIEDWNNSPHSIYKNKTRFEVFIEDQNPKIRKTNWRGIIPSLGEKTRTSCNNGIVKFDNEEYLIGTSDKVATGDDLINLMNIVEGEDLDVYYLNDHDGNVIKAYAYERDGNKMYCQLVKKPRYQRARIEQTDKDIEARVIMSSYVASIEAYNSKKRKSIDKVTVIDNSIEVLNDKFRIKGLTVNKYKHSVSELPDVDLNDDLNGFNEHYNVDKAYEIMKNNF